jgi:hypothetical protein
MTGEILAESSFLKFILRLYEALEDWEAQAITE